MSKYGSRKCKECSGKFDKRAPLDMFCSPKCKIDYTNRKKKNKKPKKNIKQFSDNRKKRSAAYKLARDIFLQEDANKFCPVMGKLHNKSVRTTEIHHISGRTNDRLLDRTNWLAVSRQGHLYIHANPKISREKNWLK